MYKVSLRMLCVRQAVEIGESVIRIGLILTVISILAGCTNTSPTESMNTPIVIEPTIIQPSVSTEAASESPTTSNAVSSEEYTIQEYPVPAGSHPHRQRKCRNSHCPPKVDMPISIQLYLIKMAFYGLPGRTESMVASTHPAET